TLSKPPGPRSTRPTLDPLALAGSPRMAAVRTLRGSRPFVLILAAVGTIAASAGALFSADLRPDYRPAAYAIKGARIVAAPGSTIEGGTVVGRGGLIERG